MRNVPTLGEALANVPPAPMFTVGDTVAVPSYQYPAVGSVPRLFNDKMSERLSVKDFGAVGDGITDDTAAIQAALDRARILRGTAYLPIGRYLITASLTVGANNQPCALIGESKFGSLIVNNCPPGNPSFDQSGCQYFTLENFGILGEAGFPNEAIYMSGSAYGRMAQLFLCPDGNGIHMVNTSSIDILHCDFWPSGQNGGASYTSINNVQHAVLADGIGVDVVNHVKIIGLNPGVMTTIANGGSYIKWNTVLGSTNVIVRDTELEGPHGNAATDRGIDFSNVNGFTIQDSYTENSNILLTNCRNGNLLQLEGGSGMTIVVIAGVAIVARVCVGDGMSIDAASTMCGARDCLFQGAMGYSNLGIYYPIMNSENLSTGSVVQQGMIVPAVGIAPTRIYTISGGSIGGIFGIWGTDGLGNNFYDTIAYRIGGANPPVPLVQTTLGGIPAARTYTVVGGPLGIALTMGAGVYNILVFPTEIGIGG